jgi:hypothetical protein
MLVRHCGNPLELSLPTKLDSTEKGACVIWGSHGGDYTSTHVVWLKVTKFSKKCTACSRNESVNLYQTRRHHFPGDNGPNLHCNERSESNKDKTASSLKKKPSTMDIVCQTVTGFLLHGAM